MSNVRATSMRVASEQNNIKADEDSSRELDQIVADARRERLSSDPHIAEHYPNSYPRALRWGYLGKSLGLLVYGLLGVYFGDIYFPGKRGNGVHFHGLPMWLLFSSMLAAAANMVSVICDHYDKRDNESAYRDFYSATRAAAWALLIMAFVLLILRG